MDWSLIFSKKVVVYGVGNILKGDDGAGPAIARMLEEQGLPDEVGALDVGTSIKMVLFDLVVMDTKVERIIIVDATTSEEGREPGECWEIDIDEIAKNKQGDFSLHLFPSCSLLHKIKEETNVDIKIVVVQTKYIPEELDETLSPEVTAALPGMCEHVKKLWEEVLD